MDLSLHFFQLTPHFFGLNYKYKKYFLQEIDACRKYLGIPYSDLMRMPTSERRFFMNEHINKKEKEVESKTVSTGKDSRTTKVSGEAVKQFSGKI